MAAPTLPLLPCLLAFAACAATPSTRLAPTPLGAPSAAARIAIVRADADRGPAPAGAPSPFVHDPAIRSLYGETVTTPAAAPAVEAPVATPAAATATASTVTYAHGEAYPCWRAREPFVPVATIFGAGLGAALSASGHRGEGALLGAGFGLLFDLQRAVR